MASVQMLRAAESMRRQRRDMESSGASSLAERRSTLESLAIRYPPPLDIEAQTIDMRGISAERLSGTWVARSGAILYLHGGGYAACSPRTHRELAGRIGRAVGVETFVPEYRLAPENPYPAALEDALNSYAYLTLSLLIPSSRIIVAGDSAGGGLALALLQLLRDEAVNLPCCACFFSPWTDLTLSATSMASNADKDPVISLEDMKSYASDYAGKRNFSDPGLSPLFGNFKSLPPMLVQVGSTEMLLDDSARLVDRAVEAGVDAILEIEEDGLHVWQSMPQIPEAIQATDRAAQFMLMHLEK